MWEYNATVIRVIDGDTIEADIDLGFNLRYRAKVRLAGINAPELRTLEGPAAKARLTELLVAPLIIRTTLNKEFEKYGRVLGVIYGAGTLNVNKQLVSEGFAVES